jgi:AraC-like DNA-binding protein
LSADLSDWRNLCNHLDCLIGSELHVNGFIIRFLGFHLMEQDPGWLVRQHNHQFYELHYVFSGSCDTSVNQMRHCIENGHFYIIQPGESHAHLSREGHAGFAIRWSIQPADGDAPCCTDSLRGMHHYKTRLDQITFQPHADQEHRLFKAVDDLVRQSSTLTILNLQITVLGILLRLPEWTSPDPLVPAAEQHPVRQYSKDELADRCIHYIDSHYKESLNVRQIADAIHLSYGHIAKVFREVTGMTLNAYLAQVRLQKAQYLLRSSRDSIQSIALKVGFGQASYFSRVFRLCFGLTPLAYRRSQRKLSE